jgi:hypothetical protein
MVATACSLRAVLIFDVQRRAMRSPGGVACIAAIIMGVASAQASKPQASPRNWSNKEVVARVRAYVQDYRPKLAQLVAQEDYEQRVHGVVPEARTLVSELAVVRADDGTWVGFRDVWNVDGEELQDRQQRVEHLLGSGRLDWTSAQQIIEESARFNITRRLRTFNTPIVALDLLDPSRSYCCRIDARAARSGEEASGWLVDVRETTRPTLVRGPGGAPAFSRAQFNVDPETGAVTRLQLEVDKRAPVKITVTFARDESLGLWLPDEMLESFEIDNDIVTGRARYTRWRRFETSTRILAVP